MWAKGRGSPIIVRTAVFLTIIAKNKPWYFLAVMVPVCIGMSRKFIDWRFVLVLQEMGKQEAASGF